jgi:hypothetical protein
MLGIEFPSEHLVERSNPLAKGISERETSPVSGNKLLTLYLKLRIPNRLKGK